MTEFPWRFVSIARFRSVYHVRYISKASPKSCIILIFTDHYVDGNCGISTSVNNNAPVTFRSISPGVTSETLIVLLMTLGCTCTITKCQFIYPRPHVWKNVSLSKLKLHIDQQSDHCRTAKISAVLWLYIRFNVCYLESITQLLVAYNAVSFIGDKHY